MSELEKSFESFQIGGAVSYAEAMGELATRARANCDHKRLADALADAVEAWENLEGDDLAIDWAECADRMFAALRQYREGTP